MHWLQIVNKFYWYYRYQYQFIATTITDTNIIINVITDITNIIINVITTIALPISLPIHCRNLSLLILPRVHNREVWTLDITNIIISTDANIVLIGIILFADYRYTNITTDTIDIDINISTSLHVRCVVIIYWLVTITVAMVPACFILWHFEYNQWWVRLGHKLRVLGS